MSSMAVVVQVSANTADLRKDIRYIMLEWHVRYIVGRLLIAQ